MCAPTWAGYTGTAKIDTGDVAAVPYTVPAGRLIVGYCVKAGSIHQDLGPVYVPVDRLTTVTITHPSDKNISHYVVYLDQDDDDRTPVTPVPPTLATSTCTAEGTITIPDVVGLVYTSQELDNGDVRVTAEAAEGYVLAEGSDTTWTFPADQLRKLTGAVCEGTPPPTTPPVVVPPVVVPPVVVPLAVVPPVQEVASQGPVLPEVASAAEAAAPVAAPTTLPATGGSDWAIAVIALTMFLSGAGLVRWTRRPT